MKWILALGLWSTLGFGFIPSLPYLLEEGVYQGRKPANYWEAVLKHTININDSQKVSVEERLVRFNDERYFIWSAGGYRVMAKKVPRAYHLSDGRKWTSRSRLLLEYLTGRDWQYFQNALLSEKFLMSEQTLEFKPGFEPEGDPRSWNLKESRIRQEKISLKRLKSGHAYEIQGLNSSKKRSFYITKNRKGLARLEWGEGGQVLAWNFNQLGPIKSGGTYPKRMSFEVSSKEVAVSQVMQLREISKQQASQFISQWNSSKRQASSSTELDTALKILLSFR